MKLILTERFKKDFKGLSKEVRKAAEGKLRLLEGNIRHPSLRVKKVRNREGVFEGSVNMNYRFLFLITSEGYTLLRISQHDILEKR